MIVSPIDISAGGMRAQRLRMEAIANNLANVDVTSARQEVVTGADGERHLRHVPYRRREVVFEAGDRKFGVTTPRVVEDNTDFRVEFDPAHPHAVKVPGAEDWGRVYKPNVNPMVEMVDMIAASRAYEANLAAVETAKSMSASALRILA